MTIVDHHRNVYWQDLGTGRVVRRLAGPDDLSFGTEELEEAALSSSPGMVAMVDEGHVTVEDLPGGKVVGELDADQFTKVAFVGDHLLVQRHDGALQIWNREGTTLERTIAGDENHAWKPVVNPQGTMVARRRTDGSIVLDDLGTGTRVGSFTTPGASAFLRTGVTFSPDGSHLYMLSEEGGEGGQGEMVERAIRMAL